MAVSRSGAAGSAGTVSNADSVIDSGGDLVVSGLPSALYSGSFTRATHSPVTTASLVRHLIRDGISVVASLARVADTTKFSVFNTLEKLSPIRICSLTATVVATLTVAASLGTDSASSASGILATWVVASALTTSLTSRLWTNVVVPIRGITTGSSAGVAIPAMSGVEVSIHVATVVSNTALATTVLPNCDCPDHVMSL